jgi:hypothetical protein
MAKMKKMKMSKHDIDTAVKWPANAPAPLTRELQIELMSGAAARHAALVKRITDANKG